MVEKIVRSQATADLEGHGNLSVCLVHQHRIQCIATSARTVAYSFLQSNITLTVMSGGRTRI